MISADYCFFSGILQQRVTIATLIKMKTCSLKKKPFATVSCKGLSHSSVSPANCHGTLIFQCLSVFWLTENNEYTYGM